MFGVRQANALQVHFVGEFFKYFGSLEAAQEVTGNGSGFNHPTTTTPHKCGGGSGPAVWSEDPKCAFWSCSLLYLTDHMTQGAFNAKHKQGLIMLRLTLGC